MDTYILLNLKNIFPQVMEEMEVKTEVVVPREKIFILRSPVGTVVRNTEKRCLFEITEANQEEIIAKEVLGGRGNWHFKSSTRQTPRYAQPGLRRCTVPITLELKVLSRCRFGWFSQCWKIYPTFCFNFCKA